MRYPHQDMPLDDLCAALLKQGATWFNNRDLLLLEELIRRVRSRSDAGATPGDPHDRRHQSVRDVPAGPGPDVRASSDPGGTERGALTQEEIAQIEAYGRGVFASLVGSGGAG